jgi:hypothetical protein
MPRTFTLRECPFRDLPVIVSIFESRRRAAICTLPISSVIPITQNCVPISRAARESVYVYGLVEPRPILAFRVVA